MDNQIKETTQLTPSKVRFAIISLALGVLAIVPFGMIFVLRWLNADGYYLSPLLFYGICPAGGIALIAVFRAEINIIKKQYPGKTTRTMQIIYKTLAILGIIAALIFMYLMVGYVVITYMMN